MFWRFGGYANISTIDTILDKPDFALEELLDEADLIQELKQQNGKLIEFLRQDSVLEKLLRYVVAPELETVASAPDHQSSEGEPAGKSVVKATTARLLPFSRPRPRPPPENDEAELEKKRNRYAFVAAEVLSSDTWSIYEALLQTPQLVCEFWKFLQRPAPLDPLQASYFIKVNESLFEKKTDKMLRIIMEMPGVVTDFLHHIDCPMVMDLLLKIITMDRGDSGHGVVEWLFSQDLMPTLISFLSPDQTWVNQTAAGEFIKAIITISANAALNEQACIGPNELTRHLVSKRCIQQLISYMLAGGNALQLGVGIIIEVIRKNNSDYDPDVGSDIHTIPSSRDPIYLGNLLRLFADHVPDFMTLVANAPAQKLRLDSTFGHKIVPLGFDRFKTCELMAELLHCSNMALLNEAGAEELIAARDAERQRLRAEGSLSSNRGDDPPMPTEDVNLQTLLSPDEGRRLEVTSISDDDGFEEVEHSRDIMNEDTSQEFVKPDDQVSRAIEKMEEEEENDNDDGDDEEYEDEEIFVDEPLRLSRDAKVERHFEVPEMMVAPLSPKKSQRNKKRDSTGAGKPETEKSESGNAQNHAAAANEPEDEVADDAQNYASDTDSRATSTSTATPTPEGPKTPDTEESQATRSTENASVSGPEILAAVKAPLEGTSGEPHLPFADDDKKPAPDSTKPSLTDDSKSPDDINADAVEFPDYSVAGPPPPSELALAPPPPEPSTSTEAKPPDEAPTEAEPVVGDYMKMQFVEHRVVPTILSFFFDYPWNNFLHNVVYDIIQQVFNGPIGRGYNPNLAESLFESADITAAIVSGQAASDASFAKTRTRMGYMGHLTLIAEEVVKFTERHPPQMLSETVLQRVMSAKWVDYVNGSLAETRERDNAILGGVRPEVPLGQRAAMAAGGLAGVGLAGVGASLAPPGGSNALAEAGLNGGIEIGDMNGGGGDGSGNGSGSDNSNGISGSGSGSGNGISGSIGPFAISSGTLISGFGSSSDEEDEDGEDNEEDVNTEFRNYTDPLNNHLAPPSVSPPPPPPAPPPLNTPPSRARLQLSARLAMRKKAEAEAAASAAASADAMARGENEGATGQAHELSTDPFADDEEIDDVDSDDDIEDHVGGMGAWSAAGRGSWWRDVVRHHEPKGGTDGAEDSDIDDDEDEEFGDFAMPEVEDVAQGVAAGGEKMIRPLAVHPPLKPGRSGGSGGGDGSDDGGGAGAGQQKSSIGGIWLHSNQETSPSSSPSTLSDLKPGGGQPTDQEKRRGGRMEEEAVLGDDGRAVEGVIEAKRRTSIEEPDEEEVMT